MGRLIIVSNRVTTPKERGKQAGGLAVALTDALETRGGIWFGWSGRLAAQTDSQAQIQKIDPVTYALLDLGRADYDGYYTGYANGVLWPLFHYRVDLIDYKRSHLASYQKVNEDFARALLPLLRPDDCIWVHDYHMMLLAAELRKLGATQRLGFFLHIPFPPAEMFAMLPGADLFAQALTAFDLVGFQTRTDADHFIDTARKLSGAQLTGPSTLRGGDTCCQVGVFPVGIDGPAFTRTAERAERTLDGERLTISVLGRQLVLGVDRLDYTKGIPNRFHGYARLLADYPQQRRKVTYLQIAARSRTEVASYRKMRRELDELAGDINGEHADVDWIPLRYLTRQQPRSTVAGFQRIAQIGLVTPLRDGMNLVAKEFVAAWNPADPGVLILSRFAGAADELDGALIVNPFDPDDLAGALNRALTMPKAERIERHQAMLPRVQFNGARAWCDHFIQALNADVRQAA